jgi:F420-dependent oxidoreductase-like protein
MDIAINMDVDGPLEKSLERAQGLRERGFTRLWSSQIFGPDTLTVFAVLGRAFPDLDLGTAVVPIQTRHPTMLAAQARTVQEAIGGKLSLGVGLSHKAVVEGMWGISFERPAHYMREYLEILAPLLRGERVSTHGERVSASTIGALGPRDTRTPGLLVAALAPKMLAMAGALTDGTLTWMTGVKTIATHVTPTINAAAAAAGRDAPRVVCSLPISVTANVAATMTTTNERLEIYGTLPSYRAMLDREGAAGPADVGLFGTRQEVLEKLDELASAGVTEFAAALAGEADDRDETFETLLEYQSRK